MMRKSLQLTPRYINTHSHLCERTKKKDFENNNSCVRARIAKFKFGKLKLRIC